MELNETPENSTDDVILSSKELNSSLEAPSTTLQGSHQMLQSKNEECSTDSGIGLEKEEDAQDIERSSATSPSLEIVDLADDEVLKGNDRDAFLENSGQTRKTTDEKTADVDQRRLSSNEIRIAGCERGNDVTNAPLKTVNPLRWESALNNCNIAEVEARLKQTFNVDDAIALLRETGQVVNIASNALAQHVSYQSVVLPCLFDVLKVCDAWNQLLTSFKISANDIIERLHIACLKFVEGYPDYAMTDIQQVGAYVNGMSGAVKKMSGGLVDAMEALKRVEMSVGDDTILERSLEADVLLFTNQKEHPKENSILKHIEEYRLIRRRFRNALYMKLFADSPTEACKLSAEEAYQDIVRQSDVIHRSSKQFQSDNEQFEIAHMSLAIAHQKYCKVATFLEQVTILVGTWSNECRSILDSDFGVQINRTKEMTEQERLVFFEESPVMIQLKVYLQRWRSIYKICSENLSSMRPVRDQVERLYTDNPYPVEAVKRAWKTAVEHPELREVLSLPEWYEHIPLEGAIYKEGNKSYALELILETQNETKPNLEGKDERNPFQSEEYIEAKKVIATWERLLQIAYETVPSYCRRFTRALRRSFRKVLPAVYENILQFREEAVGIVIQLYLGCLNWLLGFPALAKDGFHYGVLDIDGLKNLADAICSKGVTCDVEKTVIGLEMYTRNTLERLIERIDKEAQESCDSKTDEDELPEVDQTWYETLRLEVIGEHLGEIDDVKLAAISAHALKSAKGLPLDGIVRAHLRLAHYIEQLFKEKQRLLVEVDPTEVYVRGIQGDNRIDQGWMRRVHDLYIRVNAFRLSCEEEAALLEEEHQSDTFQSTRSMGLDECENMVEKLGDMALVESFRNVRTEIDGQVLKCEKIEVENLADGASDEEELYNTCTSAISHNADF